jgi:hypothetical protein
MSDALHRSRAVPGRRPQPQPGQRFYFSSDGLLRRHDYTVDVWADTPAAHFIFDYVDVNGLKYPSRRSVFRINPDGTLDRDFNAVTIELSNYALF